MTTNSSNHIFKKCCSRILYHIISRVINFTVTVILHLVGGTEFYFLLALFSLLTRRLMKFVNKRLNNEVTGFL